LRVSKQVVQTVAMKVGSKASMRAERLALLKVAK
jgi:hypothetical protein